MTPLLTATPNEPPTYNVGMAETFSWIPMQGAGRPLFARATYLANASDISLNADSISLDVTNLENISDLTNDKLDIANTALASLTASVQKVPGFSIPSYDQISFEYVGSTDIFRKVIYYKNSTEVMALSFVYVTEPPTIGNAIIQTVKKL